MTVSFILEVFVLEAYCLCWYAAQNADLQNSTISMDLIQLPSTSYNLGSFSRMHLTSQHTVFVSACGGIWGGEPLEVTQKTKHEGWLWNFGWLQVIWRNSKDWGGTGNYAQHTHLLHHKRIQVPRWILPLHLRQVKPARNLIWRQDVSWFKSGPPAFLHCFYAQIPASRFVSQHRTIFNVFLFDEGQDPWWLVPVQGWIP